MVVAFLLWAAPTGVELGAGTVTNQPTADTTLFELYPDNNLGAADLTSGSIQGGVRSRALLKFGGVADLPAQTSITSVTLTLTLTRQPAGGPDSNFRLYRVLRPWNEGNKTGAHGAPADAGETTWNERFAHQAGGSWSAPGAAAPADFSATNSASLLMSGIGRHTFGSTTGLIEDVQYWLRNPTNNLGWILISDAENTGQTVKHFGSREDPTNAPTLVVEFTLPSSAQPPTIQRYFISTNTFVLGFSAQPQQAYTVQFLPSFSAPNWQALTNILPQALATRIIIADPISGPQRFYRIASP